MMDLAAFVEREVRKAMNADSARTPGLKLSCSSGCSADFGAANRRRQGVNQIDCATGHITLITSPYVPRQI